MLVGDVATRNSVLCEVPAGLEESGDDNSPKKRFRRCGVNLGFLVRAVVVGGWVYEKRLQQASQVFSSGPKNPAGVHSGPSAENSSALSFSDSRSQLQVRVPPRANNTQQVGD